MSMKSKALGASLLSLSLLTSAVAPATLAIFVPQHAAAQAPGNQVDEAALMEAAKKEALAKFAALKPTTGTITLPGAKATLNVPDGYGYLDQAQSRVLLTEIWGNPPNQADDVLGIILRNDGKSLDEKWAAVITYDNSGYVTDTDAGDINPDQMLKAEQSGEAELNKQRTEAGYDSVNLMGWAEPPFYDAQGKRIYWAKRLKFSSAPEESLNYNIRVLGRRGYLAVNFVASIEDLEAVKAAAPDVLKMADFDAGERYADYQEGDTKAGFGLAGLVAGAAAVGVAKKVGILGLILAFAKKGIVLIIPLFLGLFTWVKNMFGGKKKEEEEYVGSFNSDGNNTREPALTSEQAEAGPDEYADPYTAEVSEDASESADADPSAPQDPPSDRV